MKKVLMLLVLLSSTTLMYAGSSTYKIVYERTVNLHDNLTGRKAMLRALLPQSVTQTMLCLANREVSIVKTLEEEQDESCNMSAKSGDGVYYLSFYHMLLKQYMVFDQYDYYVQTPLNKLSESHYSETRAILGYTCRKIVDNAGEDNEMVIWYTTDIQAYATPIPPVFVPGVILAIESKSLSYKALSVEKVNKTIEPPARDAMKITNTQLKDLQNEQIQKSKKRMITIEL